MVTTVAANTGWLTLSGLLQAALDFMGKDVPEAAQTQVMFNTILSSCLARHEAGAVFERCLLRMEALGIEWDSWTWALAMRRQVNKLSVGSTLPLQTLRTATSTIPSNQVSPAACTVARS